MAARASLHLDEAARRGGATARTITGSTLRSATRAALLVDGPHFGVAWCVGEPPGLPQRMRDVQLLPIDAAVGGVNPGECALIDDDAARTLTSGGTFVLAWSTEHKEQLMAEAYIVEALRTAGGRRGGALRDWHPADLGAAVLDALVKRSGIDPAAVDDVIVGLRQPGRRTELPHRPQYGDGLRLAR